jgi:hypothetical protein
LQFAPLRQVLDGRVKRRLRRNRLSEEVNTIEWDKRNAARERRSEIERLRHELAAKDLEVQSMRDEQDIASQIEGETGGSFITNTTLSVRVQEQEREIQFLKAELQRKEAETAEEHDWTMAARDPYDFDDDDDHMITNYDENFRESEMEDMITTPTRLNTSFPSPPSTLPNTPCKSISSVSAGIQASLPIPDPEKDHMRSQLQALEAEISKLSARKAFDEDHQARLAAKLSDFIPVDESHDQTSLDSALDTVLTQLALSQTHALEQANAFSALSTEVSNLGFFASSPDEALAVIASQFRKARLDLEYLAPGENAEGFENSKLLEMLVARVKHLSERIVSLDENIDQYHEEEVLLRQQLNARVSGMDEMRSKLRLTTTMVDELRDEIQEKEVDSERLREALNGYRDEVRGLEALIERVENESKEREENLKKEVSNMEEQLRGETLSHDLTKALNEGNDMMISELEKRLAAALQAANHVQEQLAAMSKSKDEIVASTDETIEDLRTSMLEKDATISHLKSTSLEREQVHGAALALSDAKVSELRCEIERVNEALKTAHSNIMSLREENRDLQAQLENEKNRGQFAVQNIVKTAMGYINGETSATKISSSGDGQTLEVGEGSATVVRKGGFFDSHLAKRSSTGCRKRRKYDSGLGFLEEEDENENEHEVSAEM